MSWPDALVWCVGLICAAYAVGQFWKAMSR